jgi:hypothetical protein
MLSSLQTDLENIKLLYISRYETCNLKEIKQQDTLLLHFNIIL